jgi:hypothetical protein
VRWSVPLEPQGQVRAYFVVAGYCPSKWSNYVNNNNLKQHHKQSSGQVL